MNTPEQLFFLQDLSCGNSKQVYSGHDGTGRKFKMYMSDYGKYAMKPATREQCEQLKKKIEQAAGSGFTFQWNIIPMTEIELCNFYETEEQNAYDKLREEQIKLFGRQ